MYLKFECRNKEWENESTWVLVTVDYSNIREDIKADTSLSRGSIDSLLEKNAE